MKIKYNCIKDIAGLTRYSSGNKELGPIMLLDSNKGKILVISGTEFNCNQQNNFLTDIASALGLNNDYLMTCKNVCLDNVKKGTDLIVVGNSLGGMIAQQLVGCKAIKENYNIVIILTFGSPLITPTKRSCNIKRFCDKKDLITKLSLSAFNKNYDYEVCMEDGGYNSVIEAHRESYIYNDCWNKYDVFGIKNGSNSIIIDINSIKYYNAFK